LAYHKVDDRFEWGVTSVTPRQFLQQLQTIDQCGWKICSLSDYLEEPSSGKLVITFDDAYESIYNNAYQLIAERGGGCAIFPVVNFIGKFNQWEVNLGWRRFKHLSWSQLREMKSAEIGSHTLTHPCLVGLDVKRIRRELEFSKTAIEQELGKSVKYLSLPFGRYDESVLEIAKEIGYETLFSLNPQDDKNGFVKGRMAVYRFDSLKTFKQKVGIESITDWEKVKLIIANRLSAGTIVVKKWRGES
jgi:peptidoglycan/xylan/chitin deacetylase (PgdA/CDA1 family)